MVPRHEVDSDRLHRPSTPLESTSVESFTRPLFRTPLLAITFLSFILALHFCRRRQLLAVVLLVLSLIAGSLSLGPIAAELISRRSGSRDDVPARDEGYTCDEDVYDEDMSLSSLEAHPGPNGRAEAADCPVCQREIIARTYFARAEAAQLVTIDMEDNQPVQAQPNRHEQSPSTSPSPVDLRHFNFLALWLIVVVVTWVMSP